MIYFNLKQSIKNRDISQIVDNLVGYFYFGIFWLAPLPVLIPYRYIKEKIRKLTTTDIDVCEKCIKNTIPYEKLRLYVASQCFLCNDVHGRCQRMKEEEFLIWHNSFCKIYMLLG